MSRPVPRTIALYAHEHPRGAVEWAQHLLEVATSAGVEVHASSEDATRLRLEPRTGLVLDGSPALDGVDLAMALGGDGTMLRALRAVAGSEVPVFAFNFGAIGFLATVDQDERDDGLARALAGDFELLELPVLEARWGDGERALALNDISLHRRADERVAQLAYRLEGEQLGAVRCDGLVAATPVGSTGYNLANGGPVLAWGVEGFVVSFIAPHTIAARALVGAPADTLVVTNISEREWVDVMNDGRVVGLLEPGGELEVRFGRERALLAQMRDSSFYRRLREKFGRLAYDVT